MILEVTVHKATNSCVVSIAYDNPERPYASYKFGLSDESEAWLAALSYAQATNNPSEVERLIAMLERAMGGSDATEQPARS